MANSYTAIPNIVPGNLTVTGKLTVSGGQISVGKYQRQYRIQEIANGQFVETVNVDRIAGAQDDAATASLMRVIYATGPPFAVATEPAGSPMTDTYLLNQQPAAFQVGTNELRVGAAAAYTRLLSSPPNAGLWSYNVGADLVTRDDNSKWGGWFNFSGNAPNVGCKLIDSVGNQVPWDPPRVFWYDHQIHHITGVTGSQTVASKTIYGNQLGPFGGIYLRLTGLCNVSGTGNIVIQLSWAGNIKALLTLPATTSSGWWVEVMLVNSTTNVNQLINVIAAYASTQGVLAPAAYGVDTTLNQTLSVNVTPSDTPSSIDIETIEGYYLGRTGAI